MHDTLSTAKDRSEFPALMLMPCCRNNSGNIQKSYPLKHVLSVYPEAGESKKNMLQFPPQGSSNPK